MARLSASVTPLAWSLLTLALADGVSMVIIAMGTALGSIDCVVGASIISVLASGEALVGLAAKITAGPR